MIRNDNDLRTTLANFKRAQSRPDFSHSELVVTSGGLMIQAFRNDGAFLAGLPYCTWLAFAAEARNA